VTNKAIAIEGASASATAVVNNSGIITAASPFGIAIEVTAATATVTNTGSIVGSVSTSNGKDTVTDSGTVTGSILTGDGSDLIILTGGTVTGTVLGGSGSDTYEISSSTVMLGENVDGGFDTVNSSASYVLGANFEQLTLTGVAAISGTGNDLGNTIRGNGAANVLRGEGGNDTLDGLAGIDTLFGGTGNDTYVTDGGDIITDTSGIDTVRSSVSYALAPGLENLTLIGSGNINGTGTPAANTLVGNGGANSLNGLTGNDTLTGGSGADSFIFSTALGSSNIDVITDFSSPGDTIRLDDAVFTGLALGTLSAAAFARNTTGNAADASDRIIYETDTGKLFFDRDGTGAAAKVHFATVGTNIAMTAADFFVF
jgi:Ca2+-binding RTX toxin-like protein